MLFCSHYFALLWEKGSVGGWCSTAGDLPPANRSILVATVKPRREDEFDLR